MAEYQLVETSPIPTPHAGTGDAVIRTSDGAHIPADPDNIDYVAYLKWLDAGGIPDPYVPRALTRTEQAEEHLAKGLKVDFGGVPATSTFSVTRPATLTYNAISTGLAAGDGFPNNAATVDIFDATATARTMSKAQFAKFVKAVRNHIYAVQLYAAGQTTVLPPLSVILPGAVADEPMDFEARLKALEDIVGISRA